MEEDLQNNSQFENETVESKLVVFYWQVFNEIGEWTKSENWRDVFEHSEYVVNGKLGWLHGDGSF